MAREKGGDGYTSANFSDGPIDDDADRDETEEEEEEGQDDDEEEEESEGDGPDDDGEEGEDGDDEGEEGHTPEELDRALGKRTVPLTRLNKEIMSKREIAEQNRVLVEQNNRLVGLLEGNQRAAAAPAPDATPKIDFVALAKKLNKAQLEGDEETAAAIQVEIWNHQQQVANHGAATAASVAAAQQLAKAQQEDAIAAAFEANPEFADEHSDAHKDLLMWVDRYTRDGKPRHTAIRLATAKLTGKKPAAAQQGNGKKPINEASGSGLTKRERMLRNALAAQQPPRLGGNGMPNARAGKGGEVDIEKIKTDDWDQLSKAQKDKLLGRK